MFDRQLWRYFDWPLLLAVLLLCGVGIGMIYSATFNTEELVNYWWRQTMFLCVGLVALFVIAIFDYRHLEVLAPTVYVIFVISLILVYLFGDSQNSGSQRWLSVGGTLVQPTEAGKFLLIVFMAWYLSRFHERVPGLIHLLGAIVLLVGPLALVFLQPDLGMTITLAFIGGILILVSGVQYVYLGMIGLSALVGFAALSRFFLQDYMLGRICIYLNERSLSVLQNLYTTEGGTIDLPAECLDAEVGDAASYNVDQALIAVGSGGWLGRGWSLGSQNQLFFLRVRHTDFIFSVIAEELGLIGSALIVAALLFVVWRLLRIADLAQDRFGRLIATGVAALIFFQVVVNVGMNLSLVPVTGLTLPFISYGGSSLVSMLMAIGLAQSVVMRHRKMEFY